MLDGILRAYIRQTHKKLTWKQVQGQIENAIKVLPIEVVEVRLMLVQPTAEVESRKRYESVRKFLEIYNNPVVVTTT